MSDKAQSSPTRPGKALCKLATKTSSRLLTLYVAFLLNGIVHARLCVMKAAHGAKKLIFGMVVALGREVQNVKLVSVTFT